MAGQRVAQEGGAAAVPPQGHDRRSGGPGATEWWDKVPSKFDGWDAGRFKEAGFRAVPNRVVRRSAYIEPGAVLMPSYINIGA